MFTIPSLRARKPGKVEKKALDISFLLTPLVSIGMPFVTQVRACIGCACVQQRGGLRPSPSARRILLSPTQRYVPTHPSQHQTPIQDIPTIWWANAVATGAAYGYAFAFASQVQEDEDANLPAPLKAAFKVRVFWGWMVGVWKEVVMGTGRPGG